MSSQAPEDGRSATLVEVSGELDLATAPQLAERLAEIDGDVELDCSGLEFIDARGLSVFITARLRCEAHNARFAIIRPSAPLVRLLKLTGLDESFVVTSDGG